MKFFLIFFVPFFSITVNAQKDTEKQRKVSYNLNIIATPQLYFNAGGVENDHRGPETISTKNTGGFNTGLEFERRSKSGFILNLGIFYGQQHHNVTMGYKDLTFYDPGSADELRKLGAIFNNYKFKTAYIDVRCMAGYMLPFQILNGCQLEVKGGIATRIYLTAYNEGSSFSIFLQKNDSLFSGTASNESVNFGGIDNISALTWGEDAIFDIGLSKTLHHRFLRNINLGLEITRGILVNKEWSSSGTAEIITYQLYKQNRDISHDRYRAKDFSIGLRMAVSLWGK